MSNWLSVLNSSRNFIHLSVLAKHDARAEPKDTHRAHGETHLAKPPPHMPSIRVQTFLTYHSIPQIADSRAPPLFCAVIDTLRATTSISSAIRAGATEVRCFSTPEDIQRQLNDDAELTRQRDAGNVLVAGEQGGKKMDWFDLGNSPGEFTAETVRGKTILMSTTNGTGALRGAGDAVRTRGRGGVLACCLLNALAVARTIFNFIGDLNDVSSNSDGALDRTPLADVWIICSGSKGKPATEDTLTTGYLIQHLQTLFIHCLSLDSTSIEALELLRTLKSPKTSWPDLGRSLAASKSLSETLGERGESDVAFCFGAGDPENGGVEVDGMEEVGIWDEERQAVVKLVRASDGL